MLSKLKIPGTKRNIFDLTPKERLEMLQEVQKSRENSFSKPRKCAVPGRIPSFAQVLVEWFLNRIRSQRIDHLYSERNQAG